MILRFAISHILYNWVITTLQTRPIARYTLKQFLEYI